MLFAWTHSPTTPFFFNVIQNQKLKVSVCHFFEAIPFRPFKKISICRQRVNTGRHSSDD